MATDERPPATPPATGKKVHGRASVERAMALRDAVSHAVEAEKESRKKDAPRAAGSGRRIAIWFSALGLALCAASLVLRPEFIWGPKSAALSPAEREANLRFRVYLLGQRIRTYRLSGGRLPASLAELGGASGVSYSILGDTVFELKATEGAHTVVYRSDVQASAFLGDASKRLRGASR